MAVHPPHRGVETINDEQVAVGVHGHGVRLVEGRPQSGAAVAGVALLAGAGHGGDDARLQVHLADTVIAGLGNVETANGQIAVEGLVEPGLDRRTAVARVAPNARAGDGVDGVRGSRSGCEEENGNSDTHSVFPGSGGTQELAGAGEQLLDRQPEAQQDAAAIERPVLRNSADSSGAV